MKKLYQQQEWKEHSMSVAQKRLKRRKIDKLLRQGESESVHAPHRVHRYDINFQSKKQQISRSRIESPNVLDIVDETEQTLFFIDRIVAYASKKEAVFLDLSKVSKLSPETLLYILSIFDDLEATYGYLNVEGNMPDDKSCRDMIISSGFLEYFETQIPQNGNSDNITKIMSDRLVDGRFASEAKQFAMANIKGKSPREYRAIYEMMIECMSNTIGHAYISRKYDKGDMNKWWFIAYNSQTESKINFAFLDSGAGIAKTIYTTHKEKARQVMNQIMSIMSVDTTHQEFDKLLILSALRGEFRTRTRYGYRGKGLPKMYFHNQNGTIHDLKVISNFGYVNCQNSQAENLSRQFKGTLLTWSFS